MHVVYMWVHVSCHDMYVKVRGKLCGVSPLLHLYDGYGNQTQAFRLMWQVPLHAESSGQPET